MGVTRATIGSLVDLPAVMREGLVGLGHAMRVLALAHGVTPVLGGVQQLVGQAMRHGLFAARARCLDHPAHLQCLAAAGAHFDGYLVGGATDPPALYLV